MFLDQIVFSFVVVGSVWSGIVTSEVVSDVFSTQEGCQSSSLFRGESSFDSLAQIHDSMRVWDVLTHHCLPVLTPPLSARCWPSGTDHRGKAGLRLDSSFKHNYLFIYLFIYGCVGVCCCCARAFSSCGERGLLFVAVRGLLVVVASVVAEHGL